MAENQQDPQGSSQQDPKKEQQSGDWKATGPGSSEPTSPQATGNTSTIGNDGLGSSVPGSQETVRGGMAGDNKLSGTTAQQTGQQAHNRESQGGTTGDVEDSEAERRNPKEDTGI